MFNYLLIFSLAYSFFIYIINITHIMESFKYLTKNIFPVHKTLNLVMETCDTEDRIFHSVFLRFHLHKLPGASTIFVFSLSKCFLLIKSCSEQRKKIFFFSESNFKGKINSCFFTTILKFSFIDLKENVPTMNSMNFYATN